MDGDILLISDWSTETVYLLRPNGSASAVVRNVTSPADIGIDRRRNRVLIPELTVGAVLLAPLPGCARTAKDVSAETCRVKSCEREF